MNHSSHREGSLAIIKITVVIADGPAVRGTARGKKKGEQKKHGEKWAHEDTLFPRTSGCTLIVYVDGAKKLGI